MAGMKKVVVLNVAVLALVLAMSAASADMVDFFKLLNSKNQEFAVKRPDVRPCCDNCKCTKSIPPQCTCTDVFIGTKRCKHCEKCVCTRSMPPQCRCADVKDFCYPPCTYATAAEATLEIIQKVTA